MTQQHDSAPSSTAWTVTDQPRRTKPERIALAAGAASNLLALATLTTILLGGPIWLVVASTIAAALAAGAAIRGIRAIPREPLPHNHTWSQQRPARSVGRGFS